MKLILATKYVQIPEGGEWWAGQAVLHVVYTSHCVRFVLPLHDSMCFIYYSRGM